MKLSDIGEKRLIEIASSILEQDPDEILGLGVDDAAAKPIYDDLYAVMHTDVLVESTDKLPGQSYRDLAYKAVTANVSDIAAKGAKPYALLSAIGIPRVYDLDVFEELMLGLKDSSSSYGCYVVGGDLSSSRELFIAITILGLTYRDRIMGRRGAKPGDLVCVTGEIGYTSLAYKILFDGWRVDDDLRRTVLERIYRPRARLDEGLTLASTGVVSSCMDVSDGLAISLNTLAEVNGVSILIDRIPIPEGVSYVAERYGMDPIDIALYEGGEEYELLFTVKPSGLRIVEDALSKLGCRFSVIGYVAEGLGVYLSHGERVEARGWQHFVGWSSRSTS
ncbi:MAG: thiamine-phosphate kinase [Nitrososphaerota archaeon]|nr:thiamine-phosphate kinase [Candidatus Bathyarchaeota archaeon]MDW8061437.1 thiamine-phosphate kinase [Nitrososphaerota archaeon]